MSFKPLTPRLRQIPPRRSAVLSVVDIGASKVVCLIARLTPMERADTLRSRTHRCKVLGVGHQRSRGVKGGAIVDLDAAEGAIRLAIDAAERMAGVEVEGVIVNISGGRLGSQLYSASIGVKGKAVGDYEVHRVLEAASATSAQAGRSALHAIPTGFSLDAQRGVHDPRGMLGDELGAELNVASCDAAVARNLMLAIERCHLRVAAMVATPYAAGLSTLVDDEAELGAALIDFGGGTTTVGVFAGDRLTFVDAIAVGGNHVTMDVARGLSVSLADAERLKTLHGACISSPSDDRETITVHRAGDDMDHPSHLPKSDLVRIVRPRVEEILELARDRLVAAGQSAHAVRRLVLTGGASQLTGLPELARSIISNQARIGRPLGIEGLPESAKSPAFAAALGLLVYPQVAGLEHFEPGRAAPRQSEVDDGYVARVGRWLKQSFDKGAWARATRRAPTGMTIQPAPAGVQKQTRHSMSINFKAPELRELKPRIMVCGVGGAGGNAVNNMIISGLVGVDFVVANTDAQALTSSRAERIIQMGLQVTEGLGAGSKPEVGRAAAEEALEEIRDHLAGAHMVFVTAGMGGGTGTGAAPVIAKVAREMGILTVGVVTKPFHFEGGRRMRLAEGGISELHKSVDTLIIIPNQNLFRVANEKTTFADAFAMADQVLYSGVACITDLMVKEGLINLDFADVRSIMSEMGKAMMGTGEATGERRAVQAAEAAIANPLLDEVSMKGARGLLISITGGNDLTLYEVDEAASRIRQEVDEEANIILGATFDSSLDGVVRVSVVATGIDKAIIDRAESAAAAASVTPRPEPTVYSRASPARYSAPAAMIELAAPVEASPHGEAIKGEVEVRAVAPRAVAHSEPTTERFEDMEEEFVPPAPEQPLVRQTRMPKIEELPPIAQNQLRIQRGEVTTVAAQPETRRRSLLEKLAAFGISRQEDEASVRAVAPPAPARPSAAGPQIDYSRPSQRGTTQRAAQGQLDPHGRASPRVVASEDDQLEIPAFLRRQSGP